MFEGEVESTTSIKKDLKEHKYSKDPAYCSEMQDIMKSYGKYRECIRDGNCLYTSYAIALTDLLSIEGTPLLDKIVDVFERINLMLQKRNIDELGYVGFYESFVSILSDAVRKQQNIESIPLYSWYDCVAYLRLVTSCEIRSNPDKYQPHIADMDVDKYCTLFVDPFYKEAGYVEICALSNSIPVNIHVVDPNRSKHSIDSYGDHPVGLSILYTHNHFEPIYDVRSG